MFSLERSFSIRISASETRMRRNDIETYTEPIVCKSPNEMAEYRKFMFDFYSTVYQRHSEFEGLLEEHPDTLGKYYRNLVLNRHTVSYEDFWQRYLYKCEILPKLYDNGDFKEDSETGERTMGINDYNPRRNTTNTDEDAASLNDIDNEDAASILQALVDRGYLQESQVQQVAEEVKLEKSMRSCKSDDNDDDDDDNDNDPLNVSDNACSMIQFVAKQYKDTDNNNSSSKLDMLYGQRQRDSAVRVSAAVIQSLLNGFDINKSVSRIQALARGYMTRKYDMSHVLYQYVLQQEQQQQEQQQREAAIVLQSFVRGYITRRYHILDALYQFLVHQQDQEEEHQQQQQRI